MTPANDARRDINLAQLKAEFEQESPFVEKVVVGVRVAEWSQSHTLHYLLRDHRPERINGLEIQIREGFDLLLTFYGLVEIGIWTGDLPERLPTLFAEDALCVLSHPAVRAYYEVHYPLALPGLLRRRLTGTPAVEAGSQLTPGRFGTFLELSRPLHRDTDLDAFLWLLDDGRFDDVNLSSMLRVLRDRRRFLNAVSTKAPARAYDEAAAVGFSKFLGFCSNFQSLMRRTAVQPILRAGFWYAHSYWFGRLADKLRTELDRGIDALSWKRDPWQAVGVNPNNRQPDADGAAVSWRERSPAQLARADEEAARARKSLKHEVHLLTSGRYATPLRGRIEPAVRRVLHAQPVVRRVLQAQPRVREERSRVQEHGEHDSSLRSDAN